MGQAIRFLTASVLGASLLGPRVAPPASAAIGLEVESQTLIRYLERDDAAGRGEATVPVYEYLRVDVGELARKGLSVLAFGWTRYSLGGDAFDDRAEGELLYAYLEYSSAAGNVAARLGRQYVFEGVANEAIDGLSLRGDVTPLFTLSAYAGQPAALETTGGRGGDRVWGARMAHHLGGVYELGVAYKRVDDGGARAEEVLGIDSSLQLDGRVSLQGYSTRSLTEDRWQEHAYSARVPLGRFWLRPSYERFDYGAFFGTGANSASPFWFLEGSDEVITAVGADLEWDPAPLVRLELKAKRYGYRERKDDAGYYGVLASVRTAGGSRVGGELGRMDGGLADTRYTLGRGYAYWARGSGFLSADALFVGYDEPVEGESRAVFASFGGGVRLRGDAVEVKVSADYSADPYFERDVRGLLSVTCLLSADRAGRAGGPEAGARPGGEFR